MSLGPSPAPPSRPRCVLAFGTSTEWCSVGLRYRDDRGQACCVTIDERAGRAHSRRALSMAESLLNDAAMTIRDVDAIAFDAGPGSFTGLRIGCGIAQGLGFALDRPVVPVISLEALALASGAALALAAIDARLGEVYCAAYRIEAGVARALGPLRVLSPPDAARHLLASAQTGAIALGDAFTRHDALAAAVAERGIAVLPHAFPRADAIASIGWRRLIAGEALDAADAAPVYVREKVALDVDEQRRLREARAAGDTVASTPAAGAGAPHRT